MVLAVLEVHLKMFELDIVWTEKSSIFEVRSLILDHLKKHGEPLRWSLTYVTSTNNDSSERILRVESILIIS